MSPNIIRYLEPITGDMLTTRFVDFHFNEDKFTALGGEILEIPKKR